MSATDQFYLMATRCCGGQRPVLFFITLLFCELSVSIVYHPFNNYKKKFTLYHNLIIYGLLKFTDLNVYVLREISNFICVKKTLEMLW